jgi:hypothetical protein
VQSAQKYFPDVILLVDTSVTNFHVPQDVEQICSKVTFATNKGKKLYFIKTFHEIIIFNVKFSDEVAFSVASNKARLFGWTVQSPKKAEKRKNVLSEPCEFNNAVKKRKFTVRI